MIVGPIDQSQAVSVHLIVEVIHGRLEEALKAVDSGDGVIVLCDMFGGTPSNISLISLGRCGYCDGRQLPMLLKFYTSRQERSPRFLKRYKYMLATFWRQAY